MDELGAVAVTEVVAVIVDIAVEFVAMVEAVAVVVGDVAAEFVAVVVVVVMWETKWFFGLQYCVKRNDEFKGIFFSINTLACGGMIPIVLSGSDW